MNPRERLHAVFAFEKPDRLPRVEWAPYWQPTLERWIAEGMPHPDLGVDALRDALGQDCWRQYWAQPRGARCPEPASHGAAIMETADDYDRLRAVLYPNESPANVIGRWAPPHRDGSMVVWLTVEGFFWFPRTLLGIENHLYAFYDLPKLVHRINRDLLNWNLGLIDSFCEVMVPDFATIAEDMSYNHGPMISPELFDEFLRPYYAELVTVMNQRGIVPFVDSDGDVTELIPWMAGVGVRGILPLERMAGVDVARIRAEHPKFLMIGAYDKTVMHRGEPAMRREFERLLPTMRSGGFIPSVDHQTPPDVSWHDYTTYLDLLEEYTTSAATPAG